MAEYQIGAEADEPGDLMTDLPDGAIVTDGGHIAWQYEAATKRWWPANNWGPRFVEQLSAEDGPYTLVYVR